MDAGVNEGSILGPLLFLIYINDLSYDLSTNAKLFADDTSLFSVILDINTSATHLNNELRKMSNWAFQWKMSFNPDPSKKTPKNKSSLYLLQQQPNRASLISKTSGNDFRRQIKFSRAH